MILTDITYGENSKPESCNINIGLIPMIEFEVQHLNVVKGLLEGTESDSWLIEAENKWQIYQ